MPAKYELKAPDGATIEPAQMEWVVAKARDLGLTNAQAQGLLNTMHAEVVQAREKAGQTEVEKRKAWREAAQAKFGDNLRDVTATANRAIARFGTPELDKLLHDTGMGDHPELLSAFYEAGRRISPDKFVGGRQGGDNRPARDPASVLYPPKAA